MNCYDECKKNNKRCKVKECRLWIEYPEDLNCTEITVQKNDKLVFREIIAFILFAQDYLL